MQSVYFQWWCKVVNALSVHLKLIKKKNIFLALNESLHGPSPCGRTDSFFVSYAYLLNKNNNKKNLCLFMETILMSSNAM